MRALLLLVAIAACGPASDQHLVSDSASDMRLIPGATIRIGTDSSEVADIVSWLGLASPEPIWPEVPSQVVTVADFRLDTIDVTNSAFAAFVEARPEWSRDGVSPESHNGRYLEHWGAAGPSSEILAHPVTFVSWPAAVAYCQWKGRRLPSEAEYEWAAQGPDSPTRYPWGDAPPHDTLVSWGGNGIEGTVPVASYPPNGRGLYDMSGNVWHFTSDAWRRSYADGPDPDVAADDPEARKVVRGGSWGANAANLRIRYRDSHRSFDAREMVGFRCALSLGAG